MSLSEPLDLSSRQRGNPWDMSEPSSSGKSPTVRLIRRKRRRSGCSFLALFHGVEISSNSLSTSSLFLK